jgi:putative endonuclease
MNPALPNTWYYVYLLISKKTKWVYVGCTNNLKKRLIEHNEGKVFSTKKMLPVELIYFEAYRYKDYAYKREKYLKEYGSGLAKLKLRIGIKKGRAG